MEAFLNYITEIGTQVGLKIVLGLVLLILGLKLSKVLIKAIGNRGAFQRLESSVQSFIKSLLKIVLYALVISSVAILWGVPTTSFVTVFTSAGVAVGLALQGALSNFAGGLMILFFKPFSVGDYIDCGSAAGTVAEITVIYTILNTPDNKKITVPNGSLMNSSITNYSDEPVRRVDIDVSASYNNDIEQVKTVLLGLAEKHEKVLKDPAPMARLNKHAGSSLDYVFRVWAKAEDYWDVYFDLTEQVKVAFDESGIEIPYPQLDVHMDK